MRVLRFLVVALTTANILGAQSPEARTFQVVWRAGAGADPDSSFADISSLAVAPNGDVVAWDRRTPALRLHNDAGKFVRTIGRKGDGPGEYKAVSGIAYGPDGRFYVWDSGNCRLNVHGQNGDFEKQFRLPVCGFATTNGLTIDSQGRAWISFVIFDRAAGKSEGAWARIRAADGTVIDTVKQPRFAGSDPQLVARSEGGMSTNSIPYGRYPSFALTASGDVMTTAGEKYEIDVPRAGKVVKISRAFTPVRISAEERAQYKAFYEWSMRRTQPDWSWPSTPMPSVKPPIQSIAGGLDGRVWVALNVESERFTPEPSPARQGAAAPPALTFRHTMQKWDVFEPDGRFIGTVTAPLNVRPRAMRGDFAWGTALDDDDVPTLVKLKVVPAFPVIPSGARDDNAR
jgi:hypothetical protein